METGIKPLHVSHYTFRKDEHLFLDTNIWLSVYGPAAYTTPQSKVYSLALRKMREAQCIVFIDILVVSEFINGFARWEHKQRADTKEFDFKEYRKSSAFKPVAREIEVNVKNILKQCSRISSDFMNIDMNQLLNEFKRGKADFNDQVIYEICKKNDLKLVTDDSDFRYKDIAVLTANQQLFH